ncbi:hypothetical protein V8D89_005340 [Ganoderma adspersum]
MPTYSGHNPDRLILAALLEERQAISKVHENLKVMLVTVLSAFHMAFYTYTLWSFLIPSHAGSSGSSVTGLPWSASAQFMANAMGVFTVHVYVQYFIRGDMYTVRNPFTSFYLLGIFMLEVFDISIYAITNPTASILASIAHRETALCASLALTDVTTTTALVTLLLRSSNSGMKSQRLVKRLVYYTLATGVLTAVCAIVGLITNLKFPATTISTTFYDLGVSLYACSFLSSLNARQSLRGKLMDTGNGFNTGGTTVPYFPRFATAPFAGLTTTGNVSHARMQVRVEQDTTVRADPTRSINEPRRLQNKASKLIPERAEREAPLLQHSSEFSFLPSSKESDAHSSEPGLAV